VSQLGEHWRSRTNFDMTTALVRKVRNLFRYTHDKPTTGSAQSEVLGSSYTGFTGSNPTWIMDVNQRTSTCPVKVEVTRWTDTP
jgi:hypothetical protein